MMITSRNNRILLLRRRGNHNISTNTNGVTRGGKFHLQQQQQHQEHPRRFLHHVDALAANNSAASGPTTTAGRRTNQRLMLRIHRMPTTKDWTRYHRRPFSSSSSSSSSSLLLPTEEENEKKKSTKGSSSSVSILPIDSSSSQSNKNKKIISTNSNSQWWKKNLVVEENKEDDNDDNEEEQEEYKSVGDHLLGGLDDGGSYNDTPTDTTATAGKTKRSRRGRRRKKSTSSDTKKTKSTTTGSKKKKKKKKKGLSVNFGEHQVLISKKLQEWYEEEHGIEFKDKCITLSMVSFDVSKRRITKWRGQFKCPITKEVFNSGTLRHFPNHKDHVYVGEGSNKLNTNVDGAVYNKASVAKAAAVARALDCFLFRQTGAIRKRYCSEMPYHQLSLDGIEELKDPTTTTTTTAFESTSAAAAPPTRTAVEREELEEDEEELSSSDDEDDSESDSEEEDVVDIDDDDDDDEEEYTIQYLSGATSSNQASSATTTTTTTNPLARVLDSWTDESMTIASSVHSSIEDESAATAAAGAPIEVLAPFFMTHPERELFQLMENAQQWIDKEQANTKQHEYAERDWHRVVLQTTATESGSLEIANSMLEGLAKAHRRLSLPQTSSGGDNNKYRRPGVEDVATKILNHLWSTRSAHPDARTYAAYLGCLEGQDRLSVAKHAKEILDGMKEGKTVDAAGEKPMPKPTIEVVNAVIQLVAQVGGESGRSLVELGSITTKTNKETFLSLLSSMSYPPSVEGETGGFDPIFAEFCIDNMKELGYTVDTSTYNAGLRWSGGMQSTISRSYTRPIPWDNHADIYRRGFQRLDEESSEVQEAYRMHAWLEDMASEGGAVKPNIETCEAVIQAYIRTGSLEGVQQAEMLLQSLLDAPSSYAMPKPRLQTFHPIIAAWAHSGHEESPQKVNKWIGQLQALSKGKQESTDIETHLVEAPLLANAKLVLKRLRSKKEITPTEMNDLENTALGCSIHLKDICSSLERSEGVTPIVDSHVFVTAIQVWGNLGVRCLQAGQSDESKKAFEKMYETVEAYESLISSLYNTGRESQIHNLTSNSHRVYSMIFSFLERAEAASKSAGSDWELDDHIGNLGKWVRRVQEFNDLQLNSRNPSEDRIYGDMYSYTNGSETPQGCSDSQAKFLLQILQLLRDNVQDPMASPRRGDMVRLCFLIMELLPSLKEQSADGKRPFSLVSGHTEVIKTISHLAESGSEEREALLGSILNQADLLLEKGICAASDHDLIVKEIRKQSPSIPARRPRRSRMVRRPARHHQMHQKLHPESKNDDDDDQESMLQNQ